MIYFGWNIWYRGSSASDGSLYSWDPVVQQRELFAIDTELDEKYLDSTVSVGAPVEVEDTKPPDELPF